MEKVTLNLGMHTITNNGSMIMALYAPFWMMNKTGLNLSYKVYSLWRETRSSFWRASNGLV